MEEQELVTAKVAAKACGVPEYALYRMVKDGRLTAYPMLKESWHKRQVMGFRLAEVRAALSRPE